MHLSSIRLSGFKSFVDNTNVQLPGQLVGIVGPNGCGKSNIIDAVRWVLGESSAKNLRGGQISDVIFNGSNTRPAASQATIELNFENARGKLKGDFSQYNEISVRRQVNSEGISNYYINNIRCRRKDIVDTFLGTGLGSRGYSIIQQGTISRLVEAKPEELRQYLEEAAGISHYKERRRETENRMLATRENLERLVDICEELEKRLRTLNTQAKNALTYKDLNQQNTKLSHQLVALQWRELHERLEKLNSKHQSTANRIEAQLAKLRKVEALQEQQEQHKLQLQKEHEQAQQSYYAAKEGIARTQEQIQSHEQRQQNITQESQELEKRKQQLLSLQASDSVEASDIEQRITSKSEKLTQENLRLKEKQSEYINLEKDHRKLQQEWDIFQSQSYEQRQQSEVDQYKIQQIEQQIARAEKELSQLTDNTTEEISRLNQQHKQQQENNHKLEKDVEIQKVSLAAAKEKLEKTEQQQQQQQQQMHQLQRQLQITEGTIASLTTLLKRKTENSNSELLKSLRSRLGMKRWLESIKVTSGWEQAIETAIPELIAMDISNDPQLINNSLREIEKATAAIVIDKQQKSDPAPEGLHSCNDIIDGAVPSWMHSVFFADSQDTAIKSLKSLQPHQRIICKNGTSLGSNWMTATRQNDEHSLLITSQQLREEQAKNTQLNTNIESQQSTLKQYTQQIQEHKKTVEQQQQQLHSLQQKLVADKGTLQHTLHKRDSLLKEQEKNIARKKELTETRKNSERQLKEVRESWSKGLESLKYDDQKRQELSDRRTFLQKQREQAQSNFSQLQSQVGELRLQLQQDTSKHQHLKQNLERLQNDLNEVNSRLNKIIAQQQQIASQPNQLKKELQKLLDQQLDLEKHMQKCHSSVSEQEQQIKQSAEQIKTLSQTIDEIKARSQELQLKHRELTTRQETLSEALQGEDPQAIAEQLPEGAELGLWKNKIQAIERKIQVLGEVNHAAIKDYESEKERKKHLDEQRNEIEKALATLESTINKIDKATKNTFRETFEQVNSSLQELFPRLLGGGTVKLELTSSDLLSTGVTIIARPPGKRNTSISMLSGGEKAMTAIALVFSIFQLNPAPFCMLDEVDAPLDDINTQRYVNTVKTMTEKVQFIVVTHSKITMQRLDQLIGITMSEAGVSRVVSVDMNKALASTES